MINIDFRKNEFTAVVNRDIMERRPKNADLEDWEDFRRRYNLACELHLDDSPVQIDIELNSGCNLSCPFCERGHDKVKINRKLDRDVYVKVIDEAAKIGVRSVKLSYINEPLMNRDIGWCIEYAKKKGMVNIYFSSNGILLNERKIKTLIKSGLTKILISIDSNDPEIYAKMRVGGKLERVKKNVSDLMRMRKEMNSELPFVRVNTIRTKLNEDTVPEFVEYWEKIVDMVGVNEMVELPDVDTGLGVERKKQSACAFPFKQMIVDWKGDILPCCRFYGRKMPYGNMSEMTLEEAWNSDKAKELKRLHIEGRWDENEYCKRCMA